MHSKPTFLVAALTISALTVDLSTVSAQLPIPPRPEGYTYANGSLAAPVQVDVFEDTMCPYCKEAAPNLHSVAQKFGQDSVRVNTHIYPVPFHNMAWECAVAVQIAHAYGGDEAAYAIIDQIFSNQTYIQTIDATTTAVGFLQDMLGETLEGFGAADWVSNYENAENAALTSWKVSAFRGTDYLPKYFINGVEVVMSASATVDEWTKVINGVLGINDDDTTAKDDDLPEDTCTDDQTYCQYAPGAGYCCSAGEMCIPNVGCRC